MHRGARPPRAPTRTVRGRWGEYLRALDREDLFSGVVLLARGGRPVFQEAYRFADRAARRPNRLDTRFNLASAGKMFTAVAIAQLVEAGKLSFDDPLSRFFPGLPGAGRIRVKHLLTHTSGLDARSWRGDDGPIPAHLTELVRRAEVQEPSFEPGTRFEYSNASFLVLGAVVERASGQSYYDYVREHVFRPAGMSRTGFPTRDRLPPDAATGYVRDDTTHLSTQDQLPRRGASFGGGYSTAADLLRFAGALRDGRLVTPAMLRVLTTPKPELGAPQYGYGFIAYPGGGVGHGGDLAGVATAVHLLPGGYTAIVLSNYSWAQRPVSERIRNLVTGPPQ